MSSALLNGVRRALTQRAKAATTGGCGGCDCGSGGVRGFKTSAPKRMYGDEPVSNPISDSPGHKPGVRGER